ncbi:MAG TPA: single-stranded DNA-binding protein [Planctomycetota bacterium]|nr:single-stranded DNA-binding protein [Planctomycetota bacterium]
MPNLNRVMLMGNLTRDIELKYTPSGLAVAQLGMAINRKFRDSKTNELREEVTFVDIDVFGKQAEVAHQYLAKGKPLFVEGRLKLDQWDDKTTGQKRSKLKVVCDRFEFLGGGGQQQGGQPIQRTAPRPLPPKPSGGAAPAAPPAYDPGMEDQGPPPEDLNISEENIPF